MTFGFDQVREVNRKSHEGAPEVLTVPEEPTFPVDYQVAEMTITTHNLHRFPYQFDERGWWAYARDRDEADRLVTNALGSSFGTRMYPLFGDKAPRRLLASLLRRWMTAAREAGIAGTEKELMERTAQAVMET